MAKRGHGNMSFMDIQDEEGQIQIVNRKNVIGDEFKQVKKYDIGDIVGIEGKVFKTKIQDCHQSFGGVRLVGFQLLFWMSLTGCQRIMKLTQSW